MFLHGALLVALSSKQVSGFLDAPDEKKKSKDRNESFSDDAILNAIKSCHLLVTHGMTEQRAALNN